MSEQNPDVRTAFFPESLIFQLLNAEDLFKIEQEIFFDEVQLARRKAKIGVKKKFLIFQFKNFFSRFLKKKNWGFWIIKIFCSALIFLNLARDALFKKIKVLLGFCSLIVGMRKFQLRVKTALFDPTLTH